MSLILPDVKMPNDCASCPCCKMVIMGYIISYRCGVLKKEVSMTDNCRDKQCTLFEVKGWAEM